MKHQGMHRKRPLSVHAQPDKEAAMNRRTIIAAYYYPDEVGTG
jgi:hypothetical protein